MSLGTITLDTVEENIGEESKGNETSLKLVPEFRQTMPWLGLVVAVEIWEGNGQV